VRFSPRSATTVTHFNVRPTLFYLPFGVPIYGYGAMLCLSVVVGRWLALRLASRDGLDPPLMNRACAWALGGAVVGARLLYVATNPGSFDSLTDLFSWWKGGVVAYGGFLGGFVATLIFCRLHGIRLLTWVDCVAPSLGAGLMLTRIGCFLGGCDFGVPWNGPWAVSFPVNSPAFNQQVLQGLLPTTATASLAVHPTQLYESLVGLVLFTAVMAVRRRRTFTGQAFMAFVLGYAVLRSIVELARADLDRGAIGPVSTQLIAAATFFAAVVAWHLLRKRSHGGSFSCATS
jgi:phosphatidylglycerol:prolipoprotein diacylglycerol transferase